MTEAVGILLDRFLLYMDDPELVAKLHELNGMLITQHAERVQIQAEIGA